MSTAFLTLSCNDPSLLKFERLGCLKYRALIVMPVQTTPRGKAIVAASDASKRHPQ
jgi:hypothetical protein